MINSNTISYPYSSEDLIKKAEYDASNNPVYIGFAAPGMAPDAPAWQIKKFTYDVNGNVTDIQFASGSNDYDKVWDNRASYSYS